MNTDRRGSLPEPTPAAPTVSHSPPQAHEPKGGSATSRVVAGCEMVDFATILGVSCPCGTARRAFHDVADFPGTIHVTEISLDARTHYHKTLTETYFFLECQPGAQMQLDDEVIPVHPGLCIIVRPHTRHRALGQMKVLIVVYPKFDPADEWFD